MSDAPPAAPAAEPPAAAPAAEPPAYMIEAAELAIAEKCVDWRLTLAPAALRRLAVVAINAARAAALAQMHGERHP